MYFQIDTYVNKSWIIYYCNSYQASFYIQVNYLILERTLQTKCERKYIMLLN